jgi:hypothetical protein
LEDFVWSALLDPINGIYIKNYYTWAFKIRISSCNYCTLLYLLVVYIYFSISGVHGAFASLADVTILFGVHRVRWWSYPSHLEAFIRCFVDFLTHEPIDHFQRFLSWNIY